MGKSEFVDKIIDNLEIMGYDVYYLALYRDCISYLEEFCSDNDTRENRDRIFNAIVDNEETINDDINEQYMKILDELGIEDDIKE